MLELRIFGPATTLAESGRWLESARLARRVTVIPTVRRDQALLTAEVRAAEAHNVLTMLGARGHDPEHVQLLRLEDVSPPPPRGRRREVSLVWADMLGQARRNARPIARYLVFMVAAGIIAGYGVITDNGILIVGAKAVSPDTLPVIAACVAIVGRRPRLFGRALLTLAVGLAVTCLAATIVTALLSLAGRMPTGFNVGETELSGLVTIGVGTVGVALAAGVVGLLALETRASSGVGVAISVTTIPAAAYLGVAAAVGEVGRVWGALAVLAVNVAMLLVGGTATLAVQRYLTRRSSASAAGDTLWQ